MRAAERPDRYRHPQVLIDFLLAEALALEAEIARLRKRERLEDAVLVDAIAPLEALHAQPRGSYAGELEEAVERAVIALRAALNDQNPDD